MSAVLQTTEFGISERQIASILECRYGDGLVYLPKHKPNQLYCMAKKLGFIDMDGYLTRKGRTLLARYSYT